MTARTVPAAIAFAAVAAANFAAPTAASARDDERTRAVVGALLALSGAPSFEGRGYRHREFRGHRGHRGKRFGHRGGHRYSEYRGHRGGTVYNRYNSPRSSNGGGAVWRDIGRSPNATGKFYTVIGQ